MALSGRQVVALIQREVTNFQQTSILRENLLRYLAELERLAITREDGDEADPGLALQLQAHSIELEKWRIHVEQQSKTFHEFNQHTITMALSAIRGATLINGGAAVAALAFVGNSLSKLPDDVVQTLTRSLAAFSWGVLAAAASGGLAYFVQRFIVEGFSADVEAENADAELVAVTGVAQQDAETILRIERARSKSDRARRRARRWQRAAVVLTFVAAASVISSYVLFGMGVQRAVSGFKTATPLSSEQAVTTPR